MAVLGIRPHQNIVKEALQTQVIVDQIAAFLVNDKNALLNKLFLLNRNLYHSNGLNRLSLSALTKNYKTHLHFYSKIVYSIPKGIRRSAPEKREAYFKMLCSQINSGSFSTFYSLLSIGIHREIPGMNVWQAYYIYADGVHKSSKSSRHLEDMMLRIHGLMVPLFPNLKTFSLGSITNNPLGTSLKMIQRVFGSLPKDLTHLELININCFLIDIGRFDQLQNLSLFYCSNIRDILGITSLKALHFEHCNHLTNPDLSRSRIEKLSVKDCPNFLGFAFTRRAATRALQELSIQRCPEIIIEYKLLSRKNFPNLIKLDFQETPFSGRESDLLKLLH